MAQTHANTSLGTPAPQSTPEPSRPVPGAPVAPNQVFTPASGRFKAGTTPSPAPRPGMPDNGPKPSTYRPFERLRELFDRR